MSSPKVSTTYANGSTNTVRPVSRTYPNGRTVVFDYGTSGGINDRLSRIEALDDGTALAEYQYLGLGAVVQQDSPEADLRSTLVSLSGTNDPDTGDIYSGLDRFGRVTDVRWRDVSAASDLSRVQYGYDRASNRTFRKNPTDPNSHHDWHYSYDGLQRLKDAERGTLASPPTGVTNPQFAQCWSLDATGNWAGFRQANTGNPWSLVQARTANAVNEITAITNSVGSAWAQPAYDPAGNMTTIPQPDDPTGQYTASYDAWNRLVKLVDPATGHTVQENVYDARGYRIIRKSYTGGTLTETRHYYYTNGWRCVEERVGTSPDTAAAERQHVWGVRYIDDLVVRDRSVTGTLDERLYACQDGNWNTTAVIATNGTVQERYEYDPYGKLSVLALDFTPRSSSSFDWNITYAGYRFDVGTGLYQVRFRFLHTRLGWVTRDPNRYVDGGGLYSYCTGYTLDSIDAFGLASHRSYVVHDMAPSGRNRNWKTVIANLSVSIDADSKQCSQECGVCKGSVYIWLRFEWRGQIEGPGETGNSLGLGPGAEPLEDQTPYMLGGDGGVSWVRWTGDVDDSGNRINNKNATTSGRIMVGQISCKGGGASGVVGIFEGNDPKMNSSFHRWMRDHELDDYDSVIKNRAVLQLRWRAKIEECGTLAPGLSNTDVSAIPNENRWTTIPGSKDWPPGRPAIVEEF